MAGSSSASNSEYATQMKAEKDNLDPSVFVHASRLLAEEIDRVERGIKYTEVHNDRKTKLACKVLIPIREYPKVNFVGKLMGPQGMSIKRLQAETGCKMSIMGRGSMKDRKKEEDLRKSGDHKYQHLNEDLHVMVEVFAEAPDAYARISNALTELAKFMVPEYEEQMPGQQNFMNGEEMEMGHGHGHMGPAGGMGHEMRGMGHEMRGGMGHEMRGGMRGRGAPRGRGVPMRGHPSAGPPSLAASRGGLLATPRGRGAPRGAPSAVRGMSAPRSRGAPSALRGAPRGAISRPAAPPVQYAEQYSYEQGYEEPAYEYEQGYETTTYGGGDDGQYFDYGHGAGTGREQPYEQGYGNGYTQSHTESWSTPSPYKAQSSRGKSEFRAHPYGSGGRGARY